MSWIRHAVVDLLVTILIVTATFGGQRWAAWAVWIYTPFMLLLRIGAIGAKGPRRKSPVPEAFYHLLFALNVLVPALHAYRSGDMNWAWVAGAWVAIWALSAYGAARQRTAAGRP